jgi:two-component system sensor histidine kinase TctE
LLSNLVDNAVKYTPPGGTVTIRCGPSAEYASHQAPDAPPQVPEPLGIGSAFKRWGVFLEVEDDGPGIAPQERSKALQRFYRVLGTQGEGNGLGLAIADEIARVHHSQLELADASTGDGKAAHGARGLRVRLSL